jgi:hypothetical protein
MRNLAAILFFIAIVCCLGCKHQAKPNSAKTFFDSVSAKMELSTQQILSRTLMDKGLTKVQDSFNPDRKPTFSGDTIYYADSKQPIVIIDYSDNLVSTQKYLLVYHGQKNVACKQVNLSIDVDYSTDDTQYDYTMVGNNSFYITTTDTQRKGREHEAKDKQTITQQYFKISDDGKIDSLPRKVLSVKLVDKDG